MRLFIALQLNEACKEAIAEAIDAMRAQGIRANYVPEDNMHVTLPLYGDTGGKRAWSDRLGAQ